MRHEVLCGWIIIIAPGPAGLVLIWLARWRPVILRMAGRRGFVGAVYRLRGLAERRAMAGVALLSLLFWR